MNDLSDVRPSRYGRGLMLLGTRMLAWGLLFGILFLLRSFFLLIFLTFVFGYIQSHAVLALEKKIPSRTTRVVMVAGLLLSILIIIGAFLVPLAKEQSRIFVAQYPQYLKSLDVTLLDLTENYRIFDELDPGIPALRESIDSWTTKTSPTLHGLQQILGFSTEEGSEAQLMGTVKTLTNFGGKLLGIGSAFMMSLLFSFLIVLDLPELRRKVQTLKDSSLGFIYNEVSGDIVQFGHVLGRALEAQLYIAIVNTVLTALGLYVFGLRDNIALMSIIVFLCSFVPVAGVFASSFPICLLALQQSGLHMMLIMIGLIIAIHTLETYVLNPKIYGHHLHLNPVLVLAILVISGKLLGAWGLVLGVPVCTYFFGHHIRRKRNRIVEATPAQVAKVEQGALGEELRGE